MADTSYYDSNVVDVILMGLPISSIGGYAEDTFLKIEKESDAFVDVCGVDGKVTRSKTNDRRATLTLRLMQSSPANALLSALYQLDVNSDFGAGVGPFLMRDRGGTSLYSAPTCWIAKSPDPEFGMKATEREWKVRIAALTDFTGGN